MLGAAKNINMAEGLGLGFEILLLVDSPRVGVGLRVRGEQSAARTR